MKNRKLAAMALSMLVYPGSGHFVFKRWGRGLAWVVSFSFVMVASMMVMGKTTATLTQQMMSPTGDVEIDMGQLGLGAGLGFSTIVMWGLAALDTWVVSRKHRPKEEGTGLSPGATEDVAPLDL